MPCSSLIEIVLVSNLHTAKVYVFKKYLLLFILDFRNQPRRTVKAPAHLQQTLQTRSPNYKNNSMVFIWRKSLVLMPFKRQQILKDLCQRSCLVNQMLTRILLTSHRQSLMVAAVGNHHRMDMSPMNCTTNLNWQNLINYQR